MMRTVFSRLPIGQAFRFLGNPIQFTKTSEFAATGHRAWNKGGSFIVSAIHQEFYTDGIVDTLPKVDISTGD